MRMSPDVKDDLPIAIKLAVGGKIGLRPADESLARRTRINNENTRAIVAAVRAFPAAVLRLL